MRKYEEIVNRAVFAYFTRSPPHSKFTFVINHIPLLSCRATICEMYFLLETVSLTMNLGFSFLYFIGFLGILCYLLEEPCKMNIMVMGNTFNQCRFLENWCDC